MGLIAISKYNDWAKIQTQDVNNIGRVRTSKNSFRCKAVRILAKKNRISFFRTLKINHRLAAIWRHLLKKNSWNLSKNSELCSILTCLFPFPSLQFHSILENQQPPKWWELQLGSHRKGQNKIGTPLKPCS